MNKNWNITFRTLISRIFLGSAQQVGTNFVAFGIEPLSLKEQLLSLQKQLDEYNYNLIIIREKISRFVSRAEAPLQLDKDEKDTQRKIKELEDKILELRNQTDDIERKYENKNERKMAEDIRVYEMQIEELISSDASQEEIRVVQRKILKLKNNLKITSNLLSGDILSRRYKLITSIGKGGFSEVWKAYDYQREEKVAVKVLHPHHAEELAQRKRFFRGAKTMSRLNGSDMPNIVHIIEAEPKIDKDDKYCYFVMELIDGYNLREVLLNKKMPISSEELIKIVGDVSNALQAAYNKDPEIVHRDIKPENIVIRLKDKSACLIDFDLVLMQSTKNQCTSTGLGSFIYAPPEVIDDAAKIDKRSDVYSLGMTTIFGLFGQDLPSSQVFINRLKFISEMNLSPRILSVLIKSVGWEPSERYDSAGSFYQALSKAWCDRERQFLQVPLPSNTSSQNLDQTLQPYQISEFTVTNAEYSRFIRAGGYSNDGLRQWWSELGREVWRAYVERKSHPYLFEKDGVIRSESDFTDRPLYWDDQKFNHPVQPVVGVSWFEVEAYCNWLLEKLRSINSGQWNNRLIHIPTEAQWEYAARGSTKNLYPWGDELPTRNRANFNKERHGGTAGFIDERPDGASWVGCHDMSGNVWEWCRDPLSDSETNIQDNNRPIRGGCCYDDNIEKPEKPTDEKLININARQPRRPGYRHSAIGFRIVAEFL